MRNGLAGLEQMRAISRVRAFRNENLTLRSTHPYWQDRLLFLSSILSYSLFPKRVIL